MKNFFLWATLLFATPMAFAQAPAATPSIAPSASIASLRPVDILRAARTVVITTKTTFFTPETLERTLTADPDFGKLGLTIVKDKRVADLILEIDRPTFTYVHTYTVFDQRTSVVFLSGKVTAFDGTIASGPMAKQIVRALMKQKVPDPQTASTK